MFGSINEKSGSVPAAASRSNSENGTKCVASRSCSRGWWITPVNEIAIGSITYTLHVLPWASNRSNRVSASFWVSHVPAGLFTTNPDDVAAVQNDRFMNVCEGTSQNQ